MNRKAYPKADTPSRKRRAGDGFAVVTKCWTGVTGSREAVSARHARAEALPVPGVGLVSVASSSRWCHCTIRRKPKGGSKTLAHPTAVAL